MRNLIKIFVQVRTKTDESSLLAFWKMQLRFIIRLECQFQVVIVMASATEANFTSILEENTSEVGKNYWAIIVGVVCIIVVIGNVLVIVSVYKEKVLQNITNYFIVSLAVADLLVAGFVMPFSVYVLVRIRVWLMLSMNLIDCLTKYLYLTLMFSTREVYVTFGSLEYNFLKAFWGSK